jgi:hypothetical protein
MYHRSFLHCSAKTNSPISTLAAKCFPTAQRVRRFFYKVFPKHIGPDFALELLITQVVAFNESLLKSSLYILSYDLCSWAILLFAL